MRTRRFLAAAAALAAGLALSVTGGGRAQAAPAHFLGYWLAAADGGVFSYVVGIAADGTDDGYWLLGRDGGIFNYGGAPFLGSAVGDLGGPVAGIGTSGGINGGYDLVTAKGQVVPVGGGVGNIGDASTLKLTKPIVGIGLGGANGNQYQLVAADGGVFAYGLPFSGSAGGERPAAPVVGEALVADGAYYLVVADGGVFAYGGADFLGSAANLHLTKPVVGMAIT